MLAGSQGLVPTPVLFIFIYFMSNLLKKKIILPRAALLLRSGQFQGSAA